MDASARELETPKAIYDRLMHGCSGNSTDEPLAQIIASWLCGHGALPAWMGLHRTDFLQLMDQQFAHFQYECPSSNGEIPDATRLDEISELRKLLIDNRSRNSSTEIYLAEIVAAGCLGSDHLWQDLGLWNRASLSALMHNNFRNLAERNTKDMKWKKFLYKQLCEAEGIYTCRSPSCEACQDYQACFGPEE